MIKPLALYLGLRYTRAKRRNHFISFISLASMIGIALGVLVLITVLSVMNGFDEQIRNKFFAIAPQVTILSPRDITTEWPALQKKVLKIKGVEAAAPYVSGKAMLVHAGQIAGLELVGILPDQEKSVSKINDAMVAGKLTSLQANQFNIVLGKAVADQLGLQIGDKVNVLTPQASVTLAGIFPRYKLFTVSGIFHSSDGFGFDQALAYINFADGNKLFLAGSRISGLHLKLTDLYQAPHITNILIDQLPMEYSITNWTQQFGAFFKALAMEKVMLFIILLLIIAVAVFNLVSTLVMVVRDKRADIAILKTLGATPLTIMSTFIIQGGIVGLTGTLFGLAGGLLVSYNATVIANFIQHLFGVQLISSSVYFVDYLPSKVQLADVVKVCSIAFFMSLLATIYPALMAVRTQPAEALRYE